MDDTMVIHANGQSFEMLGSAGTLSASKAALSSQMSAACVVPTTVGSTGPSNAVNSLAPSSTTVSQESLRDDSRTTAAAACNHETSKRGLSEERG